MLKSIFGRLNKSHLPINKAEVQECAFQLQKFVDKRKTLQSTRLLHDDCMHFSLILNSISKNEYKNSLFWDWVSNTVKDQISGCSSLFTKTDVRWLALGLSSVAAATSESFSFSRKKNLLLFHVASKQIQRLGTTSFHEFDVAQICNAMAKVRITDQDLLYYLFVNTDISKISARSLANIIHACGKIGFTFNGHEDIFMEFVKMIEKHQKLFEPQELANCMNGLYNLEYRCKKLSFMTSKLYKNILNSIKDNINLFKTKEFVMICQAYGKISEIDTKIKAMDIFYKFLIAQNFNQKLNITEWAIVLNAFSQVLNSQRKSYQGVEFNVSQIAHKNHQLIDMAFSNYILDNKSTRIQCPIKNVAMICNAVARANYAKYNNIIIILIKNSLFPYQTEADIENAIIIGGAAAKLGINIDYLIRRSGFEKIEGNLTIGACLRFCSNPFYFTIESLDLFKQISKIHYPTQSLQRQTWFYTQCANIYLGSENIRIFLESLTYKELKFLRESALYSGNPAAQIVYQKSQVLNLPDKENLLLNLINKIDECRHA